MGEGDGVRGEARGQRGRSVAAFSPPEEEKANQLVLCCKYLDFWPYKTSLGSASAGASLTPAKTTREKEKRMIRMHVL